MVIDEKNKELIDDLIKMFVDESIDLLNEEEMKKIYNTSYSELENIMKDFSRMVQVIFEKKMEV